MPWAGLESSQHDEVSTCQTFPDVSACGAHTKEPLRGAKLEPKYGLGFGATMGGTFEGRRAAPKRAKKSSGQQLGHIFGAAALGPYGGPLSPWWVLDKAFNSYELG
jgi:hypothetical protein